MLDIKLDTGEFLKIHRKLRQLSDKQAKGAQKAAVTRAGSNLRGEVRKLVRKDLGYKITEVLAHTGSSALHRSPVQTSRVAVDSSGNAAFRMQTRGDKMRLRFGKYITRDTAVTKSGKLNKTGRENLGERYLAVKAFNRWVPIPRAMVLESGKVIRFVGSGTNKKIKSVHLPGPIDVMNWKGNETKIQDISQSALTVARKRLEHEIHRRMSK